MPDKLMNIPKNSLLGNKIIYLDKVDSTSDYIRRELETGEITEGTVVLAGCQMKGRGRAGRAWESPPGGLWFSVLLRPRLPIDAMALLSLVFAVGISRGLDRFIKYRCEIKWPNDIYLDQKKLAGILLETSVSEEDVYLIVGVGINVNIDRDELGSLSSMAVSLCDYSSAALDLDSILEIVLQYMESYYLNFLHQGFDEILKEFKAVCLHLGKRVEIACSSRIVSGINVDIDSMGKLLVDTGIDIEKVSAGDVRVL